MMQNLHTHTLFDDGKHSPDEMALGAVSSGCTSLGFSGHSPLPPACDGDAWAMNQGDVPLYRQAILSLREAYAGRLEIFLGLEQDLDSPLPEGNWDYLIGSAHSIWADGLYRSVDLSRDHTAETIRRHFGGDPYAYTSAYFRRLAEAATLFPGQIVGHLDLVTKFNEGCAMFDDTDRRYLAPAMEAAEVLAEKDLIFEINTGAMSRGYRTVPYPSPALLTFLREKGARICITSDSHSADTVTHAFDSARALARACGYRETQRLTKHGFISQPL